MKLKEGVFILVCILMSLLAGVYAQDQSQGQIDKAYACFEESLGDDCGATQSTKQNAFNLIAASYNGNIQSDCKTALKSKIKDTCWGETESASCAIKSTALAILALNHVGDKVDKYNEWLLSKRLTTTGLTWYLEIDANNKTECDINGKKVTIDDNKKILGSPPAGLTKAYDDYWFQITDITRNYSISCDRDFISALLYQKPDSAAFHVSSETHSASEFDTIIEKVTSYCFSTTNVCDYEGSLWATLALAKQGEDISPYLPYITAFSDRTENRKYLPAAFLYIFTHSDDYYNELISIQKANSYWDESNNKLYDTALALWTLNDLAADEGERAKDYLLSVQKEDGCWQAETAFILHASWSKKPTVAAGEVSISGCEDFGYHCTSIGECNLQNTLDNFYCSSASQVCCEKDFQEVSCSEKGGIVCEPDQQCQGEKALASDTTACCIGDCVVVDTEPECEKQSYICKSSCAESEEEKTSLSSSCSFGDICCGKIPVEESSNYLLIILLVILIILIILAIIFRNQLKIWMFKFRSDYKTKKPTRPFPPTAAPITRPPLFQRPMFQPQPQRQRPAPARDKEFDETMKKLRDMSK
ncbi:MAG: hypothetical protein RL557_561 [archaeon]|jgi:hypothetical protein